MLRKTCILLFCFFIPQAEVSSLEIEINEKATLIHRWSSSSKWESWYNGVWDFSYPTSDIVLLEYSAYNIGRDKDSNSDINVHIGTVYDQPRDEKFDIIDVSIASKDGAEELISSRSFNVPIESFGFDNDSIGIFFVNGDFYEFEAFKRAEDGGDSEPAAGPPSEVAAPNTARSGALRAEAVNEGMRMPVAPYEEAVGTTDDVIESGTQSGSPTKPEEPMLVTAAFDGLTCSFRIARRVINSGASREIAQGTFNIEHGRAVNLKGSWNTLEPAAGDAFGDANLSFAPDGGLLGELTIYPLYAQAGDVPPSFKVFLDGTSTSSLDGGPEGATEFLVDLNKIEVIATVYDCNSP